MHKATRLPETAGLKKLRVVDAALAIDMDKVRVAAIDMKRRADMFSTPE
jgi:hypothetical protein